MTITSWPYVGQVVTDIEYSRLFGALSESGLVGSFGDDVLEAYADGTGMTVKIRAGAAVLRGYMFYSTAVESVPVSAASSSGRTDLLVLELNLSNPSVASRILPKVLPGNPGSSSPPALTQSDNGVYQIPIATIDVSAGVTVITAGKVVDKRSWMGQKTGAWTTARRPVSPPKYKLGYNESLEVWEYYTGAGWSSLGGANLESSTVTGVLPISKGGTGKTTAMAALNALGVYPQVDQPAYAEGRVWIRIPS
jgi:hypothetical protein